MPLSNQSVSLAFYLLMPRCEPFAVDDKLLELSPKYLIFLGESAICAFCLCKLNFDFGVLLVIGRIFFDQCVQAGYLLVLSADGLLNPEDDVSLLLDVGDLELFELEFVQHFLFGRQPGLVPIFGSIIRHYKSLIG